MITKEQECYLIITPNDEVYKVQSGWPSDLITHLAKVHNKVTVVSLYSNTVKFVAINKNELECDEETCAKSYKEVRFDLDYQRLT